MRTEVMLFVQDVESSSKWYQQLLEAKSGHGGSEYEMIVDDEGSLLFQLHHLDGDEHNVNVTASTSRGDGVLTYVHVEELPNEFNTTFSLASSGKRYTVIEGDSSIYMSQITHYLESAHKVVKKVKTPSRSQPTRKLGSSCTNLTI